MSEGPPVGFLIFWLVAVAWALTVWAIFIRWHGKRLPRRRQQALPTPRILVSTVGGGRAGLLNYTMPFVRFALDEEGVVFRFTFSEASVAWGDISRAILLQPMIPVGKGVEFRVPGHPTLTLWSDDSTCRRVLDLCERYGVEVVRKPTFRV